MLDKTPLRNFLDLIEAQLSNSGQEIPITEPIMVNDDCSVACVSPVQGGLVGLDVETGRPIQTGWKYKSIHEKPVVIHVGNIQTIIPPAPPPPPPAPLPTVDTAMAGQLYEDMRARLKQGEYWTKNDVEAKNCFVVGCLANPGFYVKWRSILDALKPVPEPVPVPAATQDWPRPTPTRQRIVDT